MKKVFVSGCFDLLHSGHVAFFRDASRLGELYVGIGSDATIRELKGRDPVSGQEERLYMVKSVRFVNDAWINRGSGIMDFEEDVRRFRPDIFLVNEDGNSPAKSRLCEELGIEYVVLERIPDSGLPARSTTSIRQADHCQLPYRLDLAGTWIDQPYVNRYGPGWAITISLEPVVEYNERSGMSTSTRNAARKLWPYQLPPEKPEKLAEILFRYENEPGRKEVSGAQDSLGICIPGLSRHFYDTGYWPKKIESCHDEEVLLWLENHLFMVLLWPRPAGFNPLEGAQLNAENVLNLTNAAENCWPAILNRDLAQFARYFQASFEAQTKLFPAMYNAEIDRVISGYKDQVLAWKLAGAGGGGYLAVVAGQQLPGTMKVKIRRPGLM